MALRSCRVTVQDLEGVTHTVEVTAESLYEAIAQGLAALRRNDWVAGFQQGVVKGFGRGCSRRAPGEAGGFYEMA